MKFKSFDATGSGCAIGNTSYVWDEKFGVFTVIYDDFIAGGGDNPTDLDCTVRLELVVPKGYKMGSAYVETDGFHDPKSGPSTAILREQFGFFGSESEEKAVGFIPDLDYEWKMVRDELRFKMGSGCKETIATFQLKHRLTTEQATGVTVDRSITSFRHFLKADGCE